MKIIDNEKHYTLNEIVEKINSRCGLNLKINNALRQWFYRKIIFSQKIKKSAGITIITKIQLTR